MSSAPMPAPHVPVSFLLAGGAAVFSVECVKAMINCSINPEHVGSYSALRAKRDAAGDVVKAHDDAVAKGVPSPRVPTPEEAFLSESTVGHMERDAAYRKGDRGDHCKTIVPGYTEGGAASMIMSGDKDTPGTVEHDVHQEEQQISKGRRAAAAGTATPEAYPPNSRKDDEKKVISKAVDSHEAHHTGQPLGDTSPKPVPPAKPGEPTVPVIDTKKGGSDSDKAKECLENFKNELQKKDARLAAIDQAIKDQKAKLGDAAHITGVDAKVGAAKTHLKAREDKLAEAEAARDKLAKDLTGLKATTAPPGYEDDLKKRITDKEKQLAKEEKTVKSQEKEVDVAKQSLADANNKYPAGQIACLENQRNALNGPTPNDIGRIPKDGE